MAIALGYSKEEEFAADEWAFHALLRAGRTRAEALSGLRHLAARETRNGPPPPRPEARTTAEKAVRQLGEHFRSHPPTADRLQRLEAIQARPR